MISGWSPGGKTQGPSALHLDRDWYYSLKLHPSSINVLTRRWRIQSVGPPVYKPYNCRHSLLPSLEQIGEMEGEMEKKSESLIWDCGSTLYDSSELNSFKRQLHTAMVSRTLSMSHLSDRHVVPAMTRRQPKRFSHHISRSLQKLIRLVLKPKPGSPTPSDKPTKDGQLYFLHDEVDSISTILEAPHLGFFPELSSFSRRTASARFSASSISISCT